MSSNVAPEAGNPYRESAPELAAVAQSTRTRLIAVLVIGQILGGGGRGVDCR